MLTSAPQTLRTQLTSSVDVAPLLLTIAQRLERVARGSPTTPTSPTASTSRRSSPTPPLPGRPYVLHATDEIVTEFAIEPYAAEAPLHVVSMRTPQAKYATYSHWPEEGSMPLAAGREAELYDYSTQAGRLEIDNAAGQARSKTGLRRQLEHAFPHELRAPLPARLRPLTGVGSPTISRPPGSRRHRSAVRAHGLESTRAARQRTATRSGQLPSGDTGRYGGPPLFRAPRRLRLSPFTTRCR